MTIYMCEPDFEGIMCGVYDAWMSRKGHDNVKLALNGGCQDMELFSEYVEVNTDREKAQKVVRAVCAKLSQNVYQDIYIASLSQDLERADRIYRFLIQAFQYGPSVLDRLQLPESYDIFQMCRNVYNERHLLTEFVRFSQAPGGVLVGRIGPKNDVVGLLAPHFADRLPMESWIIYDENRKKAAVHPAEKQWFLLNHPMEQPEGDMGWQHLLGQHTDEEEYEDLWTMFCHTIAIKERYNPLCQRTHLPLRFRPYMTEFKR